MRISLAVLAAATLALTACSTSDEPAKETTVTETAAVDPATGEEAVPEDGGIGPDDDMDLPELPTFDSPADAYSTFDNGYLDMEDKEADWSCAGGGTYEGAVRDPETGEVFDTEDETCWLAKTNESLTITVVDADPQKAMPAVMSICEEFEYGGYGCFPGDGWAVVTDNDAMMGDVLEGLGVDAEEWGY